MIVIFLVDWLFAIPFFAVQIAETGKGYEDIITPLLFIVKISNRTINNSSKLCQCTSYA
jgi:hypothetical protein